MQELENTLLCGLKKEQYNILWVEHTDKGRLELNFIIPKVELSTGRSLNPYYHGTDFHLAEMYQNKMNLKYGYSNSQDPAKASSIQGNKKALGLFRGYRNLDKKLKELVGEGVIQSRDDILEILKNNNIEVTKIEKNQIEVKLEGSKKPRFLKGSIYKNEFTSIDELRDISEEQLERERTFTSRDNETEYRKISERLERAVSKRTLYNAEQYSRPKQQIKPTRSYQRKDSKSDIEKRKRDEQKNRNQQKERKEFIEESEEVREQTKPMAENNGELNDTTRADIKRRIATREASLAEVIRTNREVREEIHNGVNGDSEQLYSEAQRAMQEQRSRATAREYIIGAIQSLTEQFSSFGDKIRDKFREFSTRTSENVTKHIEEHLEDEPMQGMGM